MRVLAAFFKSVALFIALLLPFAIAAFWFDEPILRFSILGSGLILVFGFFLTVDRWIESAFVIDQEYPAGLQRTLRASGARKPKLKVIVDARPRLLFSRSFFGSGKIYVSHGLLARMSEAELQERLSEASVRVAEPWVPVSTLANVLFEWVRSIGSKEWVSFFMGNRIPERVSLSAPRLTVTMALLPLLRALDRLRQGDQNSKPFDEAFWPLYLVQGSPFVMYE